MPSDIEIFIACVISGLLAVSFFLVRHRLAETSKGERPWFSDAGSLPKMPRRTHGSFQGISFICSFLPRGRKSYPRLIIQAHLPVNLFFTIRKKSLFDRLVSSLGLAKTVMTGHQDFDGRFHVDTASPATVSIVMANQSILQDIMNILEGNGRSLTFSPEGVFYEKKLDASSGVEAGQIYEWLSQIIKLSRKIQSATPLRLERHTTVIKPQRLFLAPMVVLGSAGIFLLAFALKLYPPLYPYFEDLFYRVLPWSAGTTLFWSLWCGYSVRHRTDRHVQVTYALLGAAMSTIIAFSGIYCFGNGWLDQTKGLARSGQVYEVFCRPRAGTRVLFEVDGRTTAEFDGSPSQVRPGVPVVLIIRRGRFGMEWVSGWRLTHITRSPGPNKTPSQAAR